MNNDPQVERIRGLYGIICRGELGNDADSVQARVNIIRQLEKLIKADFKTTEDFHFKIKSYLTKGRALGPDKQLRNARKKMKFSQARLAVELGCSQQFITQMENGNRPLTKEALLMVELAGFPVFNKALILKQLQESREKPISPYGEGRFACENVVDSKGVLATENGGHGLQSGLSDKGE